MNDTENRLRDYLHTQATKTVPADAHGPGPEFGEPTRHRAWLPITAVAAGIGILALIGIPALTNLADHSNPTPAGMPTPPAPTKGPVSGAAPSIPFTVTVRDKPGELLDKWWQVLYDHGKTVRNPGTHGNVLGRFGDQGWLIETGAPGNTRLALLDAAGKVRPFGPRHANMPVFSPDHTQLVVAESLQFGTPQVHNRIVVLDLATGQEVAGVVPPVKTVAPVAWTEDGVLLTSVDPANAKAYRWHPGDGQPEQLRGVQDTIFLQAIPATGKVLDFSAKGCPRIGRLQGDTFVPEREYCEAPEQRYQPVVSPDGRTLFNGLKMVAIDLYTGTATALKLPGQVSDYLSAAFEDPANLIVGTDDAMYRCNVASGECKLLRKAKPDEILFAVTP
ncbi:hypothetical protein ACQHIV_17680 [Kribbella sp. GL6]|uniref:hypothetical protein n=1 Tax=Kribbella sp. GL6 TaxID=3419765 RepID=UPI003CFDB3C0